MSAWGMLKEGKVGDAIIRVIETIFGIKLPQPISDLVHKFSSDEGQVVWSVAGTFVADIKAGKSIGDVADEVLVQLAQQSITAARQDVLDALGLQSRAQ